MNIIFSLRSYDILLDYAETEEERFLIEWNRPDDSVWSDIVAFPRPHHFLARLGYPYTRIAQRRCARDSATPMLRAVAMA